MSTKNLMGLFLSIIIFASRLPAARIHDEAREGHWEAVKEILLSYDTNAERQRVVDSRDGNANLLDIITGSGIEGAGQMADWIIKLLLDCVNTETKDTEHLVKMPSKAEVLQPIREKILKQRQRAQDFLQKVSFEEKRNLREESVKKYRLAKEEAIKNSKHIPDSIIKDVYIDEAKKQPDYTVICFEEGESIRVFIYFYPHVEYGGEGIVYCAIELKKKSRKDLNDETFLILKEKRKPSKNLIKSEKKYPDEIAILKHLYLDKGHVISGNKVFLFMEDNGVPIIKIPAVLVPEVCLEILRRMEELHRRQILHLDFKHRNVLIYVGIDGLIRVSLCDFGSACHMDDAKLHESSYCTGIFTPPESALPTARTDMFQVGSLIAMLLANFEPEDFDFECDRKAAFLAALNKLFKEAEEPTDTSMDPVRLQLIRIVKKLCSGVEHRPGKYEMTGIIKDLEELMPQKSSQNDVGTTKKSGAGRALTLPLEKLKSHRSMGSGALSSGSCSPSSGSSSPNIKQIRSSKSFSPRPTAETEDKPKRKG